ncbi:MAG: hypothetical protein HYZ33_05155, partial [Ignavibacteriales bacterium]|nr:hypothetical protein [Ignavibacteriales bacterium]
VTIVAMLEMVKQRIIGLKPSENEDDFIVYKIKEEQLVGTTDSTL